MKGDTFITATETSDLAGFSFSNDAVIFRVGEKFHGYVIVRQLGKGGLGTVWLARHQMLDTLFAIKIQDPAVAEAKPDYVKRFIREAKLATKMRHPHLVSVHDAGFDQEKGVYFLIMDYVDGITLRSAISFRECLQEAESAKIIVQVASVLDMAQHFGMVHRDLKPENIMLTKDGNVKLLDLGVAKISDGFDSLKTSSKSVFGTPAYIAPEQAQSAGAVDTRADIYSLGIILFEMLCGQRPYDGTSPTEILPQLFDPEPLPDVREFNDAVSDKMAAVVRQMCAKRPEERFSSPREVLKAFAKLGYTVPGSNVGEEQETAFAMPVAWNADSGRRSGTFRKLMQWLPLAVLIFIVIVVVVLLGILR